MCMEWKSIKTRILTPPQDDLYSALDESRLAPQEKDVVLVSSKVVAIHHGRCLPVKNHVKKEIVREEAEHLLDVVGKESPLTIKHHAFISSAGIDESNGNGHYILLPEHPFEDARNICAYLKKQHDVQELAVIITDSHSLPFRYGAMSIAIGYFGLEPLIKYEKKSDLFGRSFKYGRVNVIDSLAAGSSLAMGEGSEQTPLVVASGVSDLRFTDQDTSSELLIPSREDIYYPLLREFYEDS